MSTSSSTPTNITLYGTLAWDPTERSTAPKAETLMVPHPADPDRKIEKKVPIPGRPYIKLSLIRQGGGNTTDCTIWNPYERASVEGAHRGRKGDRVALVGHFETYTPKDSKRRTTFVVEEFHFLGAAR